MCVCTCARRGKGVCGCEIVCDCVSERVGVRLCVSVCQSVCAYACKTVCVRWFVSVNVSEWGVRLWVSVSV